MHQPQACFRGQEHWLAHDFDTLMARERCVSTREESTCFVWPFLRETGPGNRLRRSWHRRRRDPQPGRGQGRRGHRPVIQAKRVADPANRAHCQAPGLDRDAEAVPLRPTGVSPPQKQQQGQQQHPKQTQNRGSAVQLRVKSDAQARYGSFLS